ncbi:MAG: transposase, partial [Gammaproteobacteria bacterium]|nr:transposase [Gammaproteobacteria bacterium]
LNYLAWLQDGAAKHGCLIHAYVLMTNHVHLLVTPHQGESISRMIQHVGRHCVTYINRTYHSKRVLTLRFLRFALC